MQRAGLRLAARRYRTLALEYSCDDSCVALLEKSRGTITVIDEAKATLSSAAQGGVIPTDARAHHEIHLAQLVRDLCAKHDLWLRPPSLVCATRGPGMVPSLGAGLQLSKGLASAWNVPLIGVHHMLAHISISTLNRPRFPLLSLLCSGGHTMLVLLRSIADHEVVANTMDIAAGDSLDKCARELGFLGNMIGPELEKFVAKIDPALKRRFERDDDTFGFLLKLPMKRARQHMPEKIEFTFAGFLSNIQHFKKTHGLNEQLRAYVAYKLQEVLFDHIIDRVNLALHRHSRVGANRHADGKFADVHDFVLSGGVASNQRLREKLGNLEFHNQLNFSFPELRLCCDNAVMIGVAGMGIFEELRLQLRLDICPIRKWPMDEVLLVGGYEPVPDALYNSIVNSSIQGR